MTTFFYNSTSSQSFTDTSSPDMLPVSMTPSFSIFVTSILGLV